jgi:hypothetical protein
MTYISQPPCNPFAVEASRHEAVTTCVGFDDLLNITLEANMPHFDNFIVVGKGSDRLTRLCCEKHNATFVESHLFSHNGRNFNKGAAINQGFGHFQFHGWRMVLDVDILCPSSMRRLLAAYPMDPSCLYHADRVDAIGWDEINRARYGHCPQSHHNVIQSHSHRPIRERFVHPLYGFIPIGYFQLWHAEQQKSYPHGLGTAAHDDVLFAAQWPREKRVLLPNVIVHHLCTRQPQFMENWDGHRGQPRLS